MNGWKKKVVRFYCVNVSNPIKINVQGFQLMSQGFKGRYLL